MMRSRLDCSKFSLVAPAILLVVLLGCVSIRTSYGRHDSVRTLLRDELLRRYALQDVDTSAIEISTAQSRVVPHLDYAIGEYSPPGYPWAHRAAVLARYGAGTYWRIDDEDGWNAIARDWMPSRIDEVRSVCFELAEFSSPSWYPRSSPVVVSDSTTLHSPIVVGRGTNNFARISLPRYAADATGLSGGGTWHFWLFEPGQAVFVTCRWQATGPSLMRADSVAGVGLLMIRH